MSDRAAADYGLGDLCAVACADAFRGDGRKMVSPMAPIPRLGARLARATHAPDLLLTDGVATLIDDDGEPEGWMPFTRVFDMLWAGRRHVMMGASQIDRFGDQNISAIGDWARPKVQLLGVRGAPGNTACHPTSYFVAPHSPRVFVEAVDMASGIGPRRGAFEIRRVITDLGVFDFEGGDRSMRVRSLHPGVTLAQAQAATGFPLRVEPDPGGGAVATTRAPTEAELGWLERLDPDRKVRGSVER